VAALCQADLPGYFIQIKNNESIKWTIGLPPQYSAK
jgi:hypothetical protein